VPSLHPIAASAHCAAPRSRQCVMQGPPKEAITGFEKFLGSVIKVAEEAGNAATDAIDDYVNKGWQVKKRAGSVLPEVRPNSKVVDDKAAKWLDTDEANGAAKPAPATPPIGSAPTGLAGATGELAMVDQKAASLVTADGAAELQTEFVSFLAPREGTAYKTNVKGEISARALWPDGSARPLHSCHPARQLSPAPCPRVPDGGRAWRRARQRRPADAAADDDVEGWRLIDLMAGGHTHTHTHTHTRTRLSVGLVGARVRSLLEPRGARSARLRVLIR